MKRLYLGVKYRHRGDWTKLLPNIFFAIALTAAVVSCFSSFSFGVIAIVVVILSDLFCYALINHYGKDRILLGALAALAWLLLIFA